MTTGQPIRSHGDKLKYNNEFMENLRRQIKLNDANLQANRLYQQTGQLPPATQMFDNRTTAEKLGDYELLKRSIISDLSPVASPAFASEIINSVFDSPLNVDNKLVRFLAQNAPEIATQLSRKYKFGIRGDANDVLVLVEFLEDAFNKTQNNMQSIKNYYNSITQTTYSGSNKLLPQNNVELLKTNLEENIKKLHYALDVENNNPVIEMTVNDIIDIMEHITTFLPTNSQMEEILEDYVKYNPGTLADVTDVFSRHEEILAVLKILANLPNPSSIASLVNFLLKSIEDNDVQNCIDICQKIKNYFPNIYDEEYATLLHFGDTFLRRAEEEERDMKQLSQIQQQQIIRAENREQRELRKAQRVYVVNPPDDPVYAQFGGGQPGPGYQEPHPLGEPGSQYAPSAVGYPGSQYATSSSGTDYAGFVEVRPEDLGGPEPVSSIIAPKPPSSYSPGELFKSALGSIGTTYTSSQNPLPPPSANPDIQKIISDMTSKIESTKKLLEKPKPPPSEDFGVSYSDLIHEGGGAEVSRPKTKEEVKSTDKDPQRKYKEAANKKSKRDYIIDEITKLTPQETSQFAAQVAARESTFNPSGNGNLSYDFRQIKEQLAQVSPSYNKIKNALVSILSRNTEYDPETKKNIIGIKGLGMKRKSIRGSGIYKPLGDIEVNDRKLEKGILTVRRKSKSNFMDLPSRHVSKNMTNIINKITGGGVPSFEDMQGLSADEKHYLNVLVSKANLQDRLSVPAPSKDQMEKDFHQFEVMKGEILSGNDSQELVKKFKLLMMKLARQKLLPRNEVNELMEDLVSLGF